MFILRPGRNFRVALMLVAGVCSAAFLFVTHAQNPQAVITVDAAAGRHAISPYVYGLAYAGSALGDLNCPIERYGGNNTTRYNWQINADNRGSDWYYESIAESSSTPGGRGDTFISDAKSVG